MTDAEMEARFKQEGWQRYHNGTTPSERAAGLLSVIQCHFFRNSDAPSLAVYASHWLWANHLRYDKAVIDVLIAKYPLPNTPRIQRGYSEWNSYGSPLHKVID